MENVTRKKRILALDGGGIRGVFSIEILGRMEEMLRRHYGKPDMVLADHFDFIAGTSTGGIIGSFLSWGEPVESVRKLYEDAGLRPVVAPELEFYLTQVNTDPAKSVLPGPPVQLVIDFPVAVDLDLAPEFGLQLVEPLVCETAVHFKLGFTFTTRGSTAATPACRR